ncbi:MAG: hypothetical protein QM796_00745 [Chthoniobacteraceae bacterium]
MKTFPLFFVMAALALPAWAADIGQLNTEAQRAMMSGDTDTAKAKFEEVLKVDPENITAENYLRMINAQEKKSNTSSLQAQLDKLTLDHVKFKDATLGSALDYLKQMAAKKSVNVSFVMQLPQSAVDETKVSIDLQNIPFLVVLNYVSDLAGVQFTVQQYAIVVKAKPTAETTSNVGANAPAGDDAIALFSRVACSGLKVKHL